MPASSLLTLFDRATRQYVAHVRGLHATDHVHGAENTHRDLTLPLDAPV